ncbi:MAG: hypothetical protein IKY85_03465 [Bacteroidaceae bacterium]|nr:hypothetical protein [Bacteroidaceae bacterium]
MKKRILNILTAVMGAMIVFQSCTDDDMVTVQESNIPDGYMNICFKADMSDMKTVQVRAVDPDGIDVQNISLFCFNPYGLFIATVDAVADNESSTSGTFSANVPEETKIIHFLANQNPALYSDNDFVNKTEATVMAEMEGASGKMIYWARFEASDNGKVLQTELASNGTVKMIRNQAKISIADWNTPYMTVTGFVTTGIYAFGTVAPYSSEEGFVWPGNEEYVTLPYNKSLMSDIEEVNTKKEDYVFEHENSLARPVSVIIRGISQGETTEKYYRVALVDSEGEQLLIKRNHSYVLNITGKLTYGSETFDEALDAPFTNNIWVSIDSWVKEVENDTYKLSVDNTAIVLDSEEAGKNYTVNYTLTKKSGALTATDIANVSWVGDNDVAEHTFVSHTFDLSTGRGTVVVKLNPMDSDNKDIQTGTLLIKKGRLQRNVEISVIKIQKFTPAWVGTQVFGGETGQYVTIKFTIPESVPETLYPFPVLVTVNSLDVRAASGMQLPVVRKGDDAWFGSDYENHDYKYEYIVTEPGVHRLYFENILTHADGDEESLWLEAKFFETLEKEFVFASHKYAITVEGLNEYTPAQYEGSVAADEKVLYKLVPQKRGAPVHIDMVMMDNSKNPASPFNVGVIDEFLLYSKSLDHYNDGEQLPYGHEKECNYYEVSEDYWKTSKNGRVMMFMPINPVATETGHYALHLKTNRAVSDDVVRIASNQSGNPSILPGNNGAEYSGESYRSVIFELATHHPFRFAARINGEGEYAIGENEESVSEVELTYLPNQKIDISFDVTSFEGSDGTCVDPFGEEFEIYIDAPMLKIDESRLAEFNLTSDKLKEVSPGRFVYTVEASREAESTFGTETALLNDRTAASQSGERKTLPFRTSKITTSGNITISSNKEKVVYYEKTFKLSNKTIDGNMSFVAEGVQKPVPADAFVAFARTKDGVRIGSIKVYSEGRYSLNLRAEYDFGWSNEPVEFDYKTSDGKLYTKEVANLNTLFYNPDVVLELAE